MLDDDVDFFVLKILFFFLKKKSNLFFFIAHPFVSIHLLSTKVMPNVSNKIIHYLKSRSIQYDNNIINIIIK